MHSHFFFDAEYKMKKGHGVTKASGGERKAR
jgi:hypothetical protein